MFDADKMPLPPSFKQDASKSSATAANRHEVNDPKIVKAMTAAYFAKVTMVDDNIGRLLGQLREMGLADNTLIVFTADHGNMLGDLNRWFKGAMYEGSTRIPLLMKAPAASPFAASFNRGAVVSNIVENIDVMPTLCEMAGVPLPSQGIQGRSMTKLVAGAEKDWKERVFAERTTQMVRTPQYKLIREPRGKGSYELYDLTKDPLETNNIVADPSRAAIFKELAAQLEAWQKDMPPVPVVEGVAPQATGDGTAPVEKKKRRDRKRK
jgi:arylsulfatase A-like enzyme